MTNRKELERLRVSLARVAQACIRPSVALKIPGATGRTGLPFEELAQCAREHETGWNTLAMAIVDYVENPSLAELDEKLAEFP